jgi:outer membrane biosynthesis protein TonB
MSTAEITFSIGELANERKVEARKILWAVLAALIIHLIIGLFLAVVSAVQHDVIVPEDDSPVELTIMSPPAPTKPKNAEFIETDPSRQTAEVPKDKTFESNANSIAASEAAPTGDMPLPSQDGKDRPSLDLNNQQYTLANRGAAPQAASAPVPSVAPSTAPQPTATVAEAPTPAATAAPDQLAMLTSRPTPPPQVATPAPQSEAKAAPQQPSTAYRPERQRTRISGNISNRGIASVNALGTPLGRYQKIVTDSIGSRWYAFTRSKADMITIGTLTAHFTVDRNGKIKNLRILRNTSNEIFANICLQSILEANLPPIPEDVADTLPPEGLEWDGVNFIMYPN